MAPAMQALLAAPFKLVAAVLFEPLLTGPLLAALLKGPAEVREVALTQISQSPIPGDSVVILARTITALKWLFALGLVSRINNIFDRLAVNNWSFSKMGAPWEFEKGDKEIILITGGCSGFGLLMAKRFAGKGKIVVFDVSDQNPELKSIRNLHYYKCDVTKPAMIAEVCAKVKSEVGNPTVLINNAGIAQANLIIQSTPEWTEKIFRVNLLSHWQLVAEFVPAMLAAKKGHVVTMASASSFLGIASMVDYCSTKVGALAFHEGLTQELRHIYQNGRCIQTTVVHPTWARTNIIAKYEKELKGAGQMVIDPTVVADLTVKQVLAGRSGQLIVPDFIKPVSMIRGWKTWLQEGARDFQGRQMAKSGLTKAI